MTEENTELDVALPSRPGLRWNLKMQKFCYLAARNGGDFRKAATDAGYKDPEYGYALWKKAEIKRVIEQELLSCLQKEGENSETIMARWVNWARANVYDYFKMDEDGVLQFTPVENLSEEQQLRVKKISTTVNQYGQNVTLELHDMSKAQDRIAEILGLINSQNISTAPQETAQAIRDLIGEMSDTRFTEVPADVTLN